LVAQIAIARLLVPADYGLIAMVSPVIGLVQLVGNLGLGQAVIQRADITQHEISSLFWFGLATNIVMSILVVLLSPLLAHLYHEPRLVLVSIALAGLIPISGLSTLPAALLSRRLRFGTLALFDIAPPAVGLICGLTAAWIGWGYWSLIVSTASESLLFVGLVWSVSRWRPSFNAIGKSIWPFVRMGGRITVFNLAQYMTTTSDNMLIALAQGSVALGLYDKAYQTVTQPVGMILVPTNRVAIPLLVRLLPEPDRYKRAYLRMVQIILLFGVPGVLFILVMSKELTLSLLGPKWDGIAPIVSWLCVGSFGSLLYSSTFWLFVSQGRAAEQLRYGLITSVISVLSFAAGLPWGPSGVAAGAGLSFFFICSPLTCWGATRVGPVKPRDLLCAILPLFAALFVTAMILSAASNLVAGRGLGILFLIFLLSYGTFFFTLFWIPGGRSVLMDTWLLRGVFRAES
jgi:polysaccharide transporter, PST family